MTSLFTLSQALTSLTALSGLTLLTGLLMRNPLGPKSMRTEFAANVASLCLCALLLYVVIYAVHVFVSVGFNYAAAAAAPFGTLIVSTYVFWKVFRVGERLKRADSGYSPFELNRGQSDPLFKVQNTLSAAGAQADI
jgi:hypothetical protein